MAGDLKSKDRVDYIAIILPLKLMAFWDWYPNPDKEYKIFINNIYLAFVLFVLINFTISLFVNLYTEWVDFMGSLEKLTDSIPFIVAASMVIHFALHKKELYELVDFMNENFRFHSARGLTNTTMEQSYKLAKNFACMYSICTLFSATMYVVLPMIIHLWTGQPLQYWIFADADRASSVVLAFLRQCLVQAFVGLAFGQLGVFFASNAILICGQLDLLCCSLRNVRYTALLQAGVQHKALVRRHRDIVDDERHNYIYSTTELKDSQFHYDRKVTSYFEDRRREFGRFQKYFMGNYEIKDIYSPEFDEATMDALCECARVCQTVVTYKEKFEAFVSPLLVLRVIQVTLHLCTLLYSVSVKFELTIVEYIAATSLDMFVYCYFGNQIILQASRVSTAAYQSAWPTMGARPRRALLNILLANLRPVVLRAGGFLPIQLNTFVGIIKTSFSYYTLLDKMNH